MTGKWRPHNCKCSTNLPINPKILQFFNTWQDFFPYLENVLYPFLAQNHGLEFTGTQQPVIKDLVSHTPGVSSTGLSKVHRQISSPSSQNTCRLVGRTIHATSRTLLRVRLFWCSTTRTKPVSTMKAQNMAYLDSLPPLESIWNYTRGGSWSSVWWRLPDVPSKPSQCIWACQVWLASSSPSELTHHQVVSRQLRPLFTWGHRSDETTQSHSSNCSPRYPGAKSTYGHVFARI